MLYVHPTPLVLSVGSKTGFPQDVSVKSKAKLGDPQEPKVSSEGRMVLNATESTTSRSKSASSLTFAACSQVCSNIHHK